MEPTANGRSNVEGMQSGIAAKSRVTRLLA
jgi:hypothetical protein